MIDIRRNRRRHTQRPYEWPFVRLALTYTHIYNIHAHIAHIRVLNAHILVNFINIIIHHNKIRVYSSYRGVLDTPLFVSGLPLVSGFLRVPQFPPPIKLTATI